MSFHLEYGGPGWISQIRIPDGHPRRIPHMNKHTQDGHPRRTSLIDMISMMDTISQMRVARQCKAPTVWRHHICSNDSALSLCDDDVWEFSLFESKGCSGVSLSNRMSFVHHTSLDHGEGHGHRPNVPYANLPRAARAYRD